MKIKIPSVNYHVWQPCNMNCSYCFGKFDDVKKNVLPKGHLSLEHSLALIERLAGYGFEKITFAGGEPTLCKWLPDLVAYAKRLKLTTGIVTNGSKLNQAYISNFNNALDWISLSIDTINDGVAVKIGRTQNGRELTLEQYKFLCLLIKNNNIRLKINTVVSAINYLEDFSNFIISTSPDRWKVLQVLPVQGQNGDSVNDFVIDSEKFTLFKERHSYIKEAMKMNIVFEDNELMTGSYVMIDPAGRFFDNVNGDYKYSAAILDVGVERALQQVTCLEKRFYDREGIYNWVR